VGLWAWNLVRDGVPVDMGKVSKVEVFSDDVRTVGEPPELGEDHGPYSFPEAGQPLGRQKRREYSITRQGPRKKKKETCNRRCGFWNAGVIPCGTKLEQEPGCGKGELRREAYGERWKNGALLFTVRRYCRRLRPGVLLFSHK